MDHKLLRQRQSSESDSDESSGDLRKNELLSYTKTRAKRRYIILAFFSFAGLSSVGLIVLVYLTRQSWKIATPASSPSQESSHEQVEVKAALPHPLDALASLNGPPTALFRDNLRPELKYITSWPSAGWTNDVMTYANLIYLGFITDHIPVIPIFPPSHVAEGGSDGPSSIFFGDVFDVPRLRNLTGKAILEWRDVKDPSSESVDELGCWNTWESVQSIDHRPRLSAVPEQLKLDISYTKAPSWIRALPEEYRDPHATFWSLARLAFPESRQTSLVPPLASPIHGVLLPPDEQMLCYDYMYFVCAQQPFEFDMDYSPAWREVAQHLHWIPSLEKLANMYVNAALGLPEDGPTPPYISVHVRHSDFAYACGDTPFEECFASIPTYARRVGEVREQILQKKGIIVEHVIVTSDETDDSWWQEIFEQGWKRPDHSQTTGWRKHWYPILIDAVIQSGGIGFVGTDGSTMSVLAKRRVKVWNNGVTALVKWGRAGADDH